MVEMPLLIEIHDGVMMLTDRPMDPTILEIKRFLAGEVLFGGEEGAHHDMARIGTVRLPQPHTVKSGRVVGYVNDNAFMLGMEPNCYVDGQLIYGPMLILGQGPAGEDRVLDPSEAQYTLVRATGDAYPTLKLYER